MGLTEVLFPRHTTTTELNLDYAPYEGTFMVWLHLLPGAEEDFISDVSGCLMAPLISGEQHFCSKEGEYLSSFSKEQRHMAPCHQSSKPFSRGARARLEARETHLYLHSGIQELS